MDLTPLNDLLKEQPELGPLAFKESSGFADARRVNADNREFAGLFQIGDARLQDLKDDGVVPEDATLQTLLDDPALYAQAANAHFDDYRQSIRNPDWKWNKYVGTEVDGIPVTETGLMYAMHLAGRTGTERFLRSGADPADELGTSISDYMRLGARVESDEPDPELMTVFRARLRERAAETAAAAVPAAAAAEQPEGEEAEDPELQELAEVEPEQPPPAEPPPPDVRAEDVVPVSQQAGPRTPLVRNTIEGPDSNPLIPILREQGFNQAVDYPLSRMLRQGYTTTQMVNSLPRRTGMDWRWGQLVEQARAYGISDDVILGAMIGADDRKTMALIEGATRGGAIAAGAAAGALAGAKAGMILGPKGSLAGSIIGTIAGGIAGAWGTEELLDAVGPEITEYTPEARIVYNAAETGASILAITPAFRQLPAGMNAIREAKVEVARRLAAQEGRVFDDSLVQAGRMERVLNAVARNIGQPGTAVRRRYNVVETVGAGVGAGAAASAQYGFPENPWVRLGAEIGSGLSAASLVAVAGGVADMARQVISGYSTKGASMEAMRYAVSEFMANGNAVVTPLIFRQALSTGEQQKVLSAVNRTLRGTGVEDEIPSVDAFKSLPEEVQTRLLSNSEGDWAYRATITNTNFVNAPRRLRAEMLRASGPALLKLVRDMSDEGRRNGFSPSATQFMPEELMKIAEGLARRDPQFGSRLSEQKLTALQEMVNAMRLMFDSIAPGAGARKADMAQLLSLREELFTQIHQEMLRSVDRRAAAIVADRKERPSEVATDFTETLVNMYRQAYDAAKEEADQLYRLVDNNEPIFINNFRGQAADQTTRTLYGPQLPSAQDPAVRRATWMTEPREAPEVEGLSPGDAREYLEALVADLRANIDTLTQTEREFLTQSEELIKQFDEAGPVSIPLRQVRRLRSALQERSRKEFVANGGPTEKSRYYRLMAQALSRDIDETAEVSNNEALKTAQAFYRAMQSTFAEGLGNTVAKYLSPFDKSPRNPSVLIDAIIPSNAANVSVRMEELDNIVKFLQGDLRAAVPEELQGAVDELAMDAAGKRDQVLRLSAKILSQRAIKRSDRAPTDPVTVDDIDPKALSDIRIEYGDIIERMPPESRRLFEDVAEAAKAINKDRNLLGDIGSTNTPLSSAFGTEDRMFDSFVRVLSKDGNLLSDSKFPSKYSASLSGSELLAVLSDPVRVLNPVEAFNDFTRLVGRLASEADNGPLSEQVLQRILEDPRFSGFRELLESLKNPAGQSVELREVATALDDLRYPVSASGRRVPGASPSGARLRNGLKRAFADFALTYDRSQNVSFKALADRALLTVGTSKTPTESIDSLSKKARGSRSQENSMLDIMQKNGVISQKQKEGIENFLHFGAQAENILYNTVPTDPEGGFESILSQKGLMDTAIRSAGAAFGSFIGRLTGNPQVLVSAYAGSRAATNAFNKVPIAHAQQVLKDVLLNDQFDEALETFLKQIEDVGAYQELVSLADRLAATFYTPRVTAATLRAFRELPAEFYEEDTSNVPTQEELKNRQRSRSENPLPFLAPQAAAPAVPRQARPPMIAPPLPEPSPMNFQESFPELFAQQQQQPQQAAPSGPANPMAGAQLFPNDPMFQQRGIQALMQG